jgi:xylulokinase
VLAIIDRDRDWSHVVPRVAAPGEVVGEWNGARVAVGTGDNMAAALGLGLQAGRAVVSFGTSGTAFTVSTSACADPSGAVAGFADATGQFLPLVCTLNSTKVLDAARRLLAVDHDQFDRLALSCDSGAGGLTLLPYLDGERTPDLPKATGVLMGLRSDVSREQLARAMVEGVVCGMLDALDALRAHAPVHSVVVTGGGARSAAVRTIFAQLCDVPVSVADADEAVATGACVQAAAVVDGESHSAICERWNLATSSPVEVASLDASSVRARYAEVRQASYPTP